MDKNPKKLVLDILEIIGYQNDKEAYFSRFTQLANQEAMLALLEGATEEQMKIMEEGVTTAANPDSVRELLIKTFTEEAFTKAVAASAESMIKDLFDKVAPSLSPDKAKRLIEYFSK